MIITYNRNIDFDQTMHKIIINILLTLMIFPVICLLLPIFVQSDNNYFVPNLFIEYFVNTVVLMIGTGFLTFFLGTSLALLVNFFNFPGKNIVKNILFMPLALPVYIMALVYTKLADSFYIFDLSHIQSLFFAICVMSICLYPYVYMLVSSRFSSLMNTVAMARTMGKKPFEILFVLVISMARPSIVAGIFMVLMEVIADFGAVQFFSIQTFTTGIYRNHFLLNNHALSSILTIILLIFIYALLYFENISRKKIVYSNILYTSEFNNVQWNIAGFKAFFVLLFCSMPIILGFVLPVSVLVSWSFKATINLDKIATLLFNTVFVALVATITTVIISLVFAYSLRVKEINKSLMKLACMGYAIPGIVVAITILGFLGLLSNFLNILIQYIFNYKMNILLIGTMFALIYSYVFRFLSISVSSIESCLMKIPSEFDLTVKMLGKSYLQIVELYVPMIAKSLYTAFILIFIEIIKELPATLIVRPFNFETFATKVYLLVADERYYDAAIPALMIAGVGVISVILLIKLIHGKNLHSVNSNVKLNCLCDMCIGIKNEC